MREPVRHAAFLPRSTHEAKRLAPRQLHSLPPRSPFRLPACADEQLLVAVYERQQQCRHGVGVLPQRGGLAGV